MFNELPYGIMDTISDLNLESQKELLETWLFVAFDMQKQKRSPNEIINADFRDDILKFSSVDSDALLALVNLLKQGIYALGKNANIKILIEYIAAYCTAIKNSFI